MPGLAIALIEDDRVTYVRGYGDAGGGRRMTADIPMPIGSTTKTFTAVAVLQLAEQGRIDLDAPVSTYLPWFRIADKQASEGLNLLGRAMTGSSQNQASGISGVVQSETSAVSSVIGQQRC